MQTCPVLCTAPGAVTAATGAQHHLLPPATCPAPMQLSHHGIIVPPVKRGKRSAPASTSTIGACRTTTGRACTSRHGHPHPSNTHASTCSSQPVAQTTVTGAPASLPAQCCSRRASVPPSHHPQGPEHATRLSSTSSLTSSRAASEPASSACSPPLQPVHPGCGWRVPAQCPPRLRLLGQQHLWLHGARAAGAQRPVPAQAHQVAGGQLAAVAAAGAPAGHARVDPQVGLEDLAGLDAHVAQREALRVVGQRERAEIRPCVCVGNSMQAGKAVWLGCRMAQDGAQRCPAPAAEVQGSASAAGSCIGCCSRSPPGGADKPWHQQRAARLQLHSRQLAHAPKVHSGPHTASCCHRPSPTLASRRCSSSL